MTDEKRYNNTKILYNIIDTIINFLIIVFLGFSAFSIKIAQNFQNGIFTKILYFFFIIILIFIINSMISYFSSYKLEKKYSLSNENFKSWMFKNLKMLLVSEIIGIPIFLLTHIFILNFPKSWWIYLFLVLFILNIVLGIIAPVIIFPLFYKFTRLDDNNLIDRITQLSKKYNFKVKGVYKFDMSKETKKANAAFTGLGKSKRIILGDTLLEKFNNEEILSVFAHEIGHYKKNHILKTMFISTIILFVSLFGISFYKFENPENLHNVFVVILFVSLIQFFASIFENYLSRKYEYEADDFSKDAMEDGLYLISALKKLKKINMADSEPHWLIELLFYSHPSIKKRINNLEKRW